MGEVGLGKFLYVSVEHTGNSNSTRGTCAGKIARRLRYQGTSVQVQRIGVSKCFRGMKKTRGDIVVILVYFSSLHIL
jgi:hypothetical protein